MTTPSACPPTPLLPVSGHRPPACTALWLSPWTYSTADQSSRAAVAGTAENSRPGLAHLAQPARPLGLGARTGRLHPCVQGALRSGGWRGLPAEWRTGQQLVDCTAGRRLCRPHAAPLQEFPLCTVAKDLSVGHVTALPRRMQKRRREPSALGVLWQGREEADGLTGVVLNAPGHLRAVRPPHCLAVSLLRRLGFRTSFSGCRWLTVTPTPHARPPLPLAPPGFSRLFLGAYTRVHRTGSEKHKSKQKRVCSNSHFADENKGA